jgi:hypothetical protein
MVTITEPSGETVSKTALNAAITEANVAKDGVVTNTAAANVFEGTKWVTSAVQWYVDGVLLDAETAASITISGAAYDLGIHRLGVTVSKNSVPYFKEIIFTVTDRGRARTRLAPENFSRLRAH